MSLRNKNRFYKWLCYSLYLVIFTALQLSVFSRFPIFGASPMLAPAIVAIVSMLECSTGAVIFSLCTGVMTDALVGPTGYYTIMLTLLSVVLVNIVERIVVRSGFIMLLLCALSLLVTHLVRTLLYTFFADIGAAGALWAIMFPELLYSFIITVPMMLLLSRVDSKFNRNTRHRR